MERIGSNKLRANQELILQISCDMCMTFTRKYETQEQMGGLAYKKARENYLR